LEAAESAGRFPKYSGLIEAELAKAAQYRDVLEVFREIASLENVTLSQPLLKPLAQLA